MKEHTVVASAASKGSGRLSPPLVAANEDESERGIDWAAISCCAVHEI